MTDNFSGRRSTRATVWFVAVWAASAASLASPASTTVLADDLVPLVPDGFVVDVVATEPLVANPCVLAFDRRGRLFVGQGPQYRNPTPETPGDRVDLLLDTDGDGVMDRRHTFADGFNCIQGIAWKDDELWVANAPDLTVVRDLDGDDVADRYVRVYTDLGNLEHALHGLNFAPDGKLYMSKGNSKGFNRRSRYAPRAFRQLWGLPDPVAGAAELPASEAVTREQYRRSYHPPQDDWGRQGGILRCDPRVDGTYGQNLEIVSRGFRNPWDIAFDAEFNWLGTDNDQTQGDKIFSPFFGADFGWGHTWSSHWSGAGHLPTVPASAPLFEGSGTGVIAYHASQFPPQWRDGFYVNDWLRRETRFFAPQWQGALLTCRGEAPILFAHAGGGRAMAASSGRLYDPTDLEVGPDGALYVLSWGRGYGAKVVQGKQVDAGRVYRIRYQKNPLLDWRGPHRTQPLADWNWQQLFADLGSAVPAWRTDAQAELIRRGDRSKPALRELLAKHRRRDALPAPGLTTWALWTLGQIDLSDQALDRELGELAADPQADQNLRIQAWRILAHRIGALGLGSLPPTIAAALADKHPRVRWAAVQAIEQAEQRQFSGQLWELAATEEDRIVFYSLWNTLRKLASPERRRQALRDPQPGVRVAALLGLLQDEELSADQVQALAADPDETVAQVAGLWLEKSGEVEPIIELLPPPGEYPAPLAVSLETPLRGARVTYTLDGSIPSKTSAVYRAPIPLSGPARLRVYVEHEGLQVGPITTADYRVRHSPPVDSRRFLSEIQAASGRAYQMDWTGLAPGKRHYSDRAYVIRDVPAELRGLPFLRTANDDDRSRGASFLRLKSDSAVTVWVGVDQRCEGELAWMRVGMPGGFEKTSLQLATTDPTYRLYRREFPAGPIVLGGNTDADSDSRRGNYLLAFEPRLLQADPDRAAATAADVLAALPQADVRRGRELFLHRRGAGCVKCHQLEGLGRKFAPDLSDIGIRAKPEVLIQSILEPSAVITEGFAQQQIVTRDGKVFSGAVLEETSRQLTLVDSQGRATRIDQAEIDERIGTKLSPMPTGFERLLTAQQLADLVAWLQTQRRVGDRQGFSFREGQQQLEIYLGTQKIASYLKSHPQLTRPALAHVSTPSGIPLTRSFPPQVPRDLPPGAPAGAEVDHAAMHPGIWISFGDLHGNDYWRLRARAEFDQFTEPPQGARDRGQFTARSRYLSEDGARVVCTETIQYRFQRIPQGVLLVLDAQYASRDADFYFGDQEEAGLAVRVEAALRVSGGQGTILNDRGERNGEEIWGKTARWANYFGTVAGRQVGVMMVPDPGNPRPSWFHARDYGLLVANPFPRQPKSRREPYVKTFVKRGQPYHLRYAVLLHEAPADRPLDHKTAYQQALQALGDNSAAP